MVVVAKHVVPTVGDPASALQLGNFAKATASALAELRAASLKVRRRPYMDMYHMICYIMVLGTRGMW